MILKGLNGKEAPAKLVGSFGNIKIKNEQGQWEPVTWKDFGGEGEIVHKSERKSS